MSEESRCVHTLGVCIGQWWVQTQPDLHSELSCTCLCRTEGALLAGDREEGACQGRLGRTKDRQRAPSPGKMGWGRGRQAVPFPTQKVATTFAVHVTPLRTLALLLSRSGQQRVQHLPQPVKLSPLTSAARVGVLPWAGCTEGRLLARAAQ